VLIVLLVGLNETEVPGTMLEACDDDEGYLEENVAEGVDDNVDILELENSAGDCVLDVARVDDILLNEVRRDELRLLLLNELAGMLVKEDLLVEIWVGRDLLEVLVGIALVDDNALVEDALVEMSWLPDVLATLKKLFEDTFVVIASLDVDVVEAFDDERVIDFEEDSKVDFFVEMDVLVLLDILVGDFGDSVTHLQAFLTAGTFTLGIGESCRSLHPNVSVRTPSKNCIVLTRTQRRYRTTTDSEILCGRDWRICLDKVQARSSGDALHWQLLPNSSPSYRQVQHW